MAHPGKPQPPKPQSSLPHHRQQQTFAIQPIPEPKVTDKAFAQPRSTDRLGDRDRIGIAPIRSRIQQISIEKAIAMSTGAHVAGPIVAALLFFLIAFIIALLMNINIWDWFKPKETKKPDMEFTLVRDTQAKRPEKPLFRGQFNQQAGGKTDPSQPVKPPEPTAAQSKPVETPPKPKTPPAQQPKQTVKPQPKQAPTPKPPEPPKQVVKPEKVMKPVPLPTFKPLIASPKPPEKRSPQGPVAETMKQQTASTPRPSQIGNPGMMASASQGSPGLSRPNARGASGAGNPQTGTSAEPGVDVAADVDFGPFMADLERRIKRNWNPPRSSRSKRVKVKFYLTRDGRLTKLELMEPSNDPLADESALRAVQVSAPFKAFPPQVQEDILPIEFTFDYNVFNPQNVRSNYR